LECLKVSIITLIDLDKNEKVTTKGKTYSIELGKTIDLVSNKTQTYKVTFNISEGILISDKNTEEKSYLINIKNGVYTYNKSKDQFGYKNRNGAYLFATTDTEPRDFNVIVDKSTYYVGTYIVQLNLYFEKSMMKIKFYKADLLNANNIIECETVLYKRKEKDINSDGEAFVLSIQSNINNMLNGLTSFWTDSNGTIMMERRQNTRFTWDFRPKEFISSNLYPVNSAISIRETKTKSDKPSHLVNSKDDEILTVYNDRSQAGTSLKKGEIQLLLNQYANQDDRKGLAVGIFEDESNNENFSVKHYVAVSNNYNKDFLDKLLNLKVMTIKSNDNQKGIYKLFKVNF